MTEAPADTFDLEQVSIRPATCDDQAAVSQLFRSGLEEGMLRDNDTGADIENLEAGYLADNGRSNFWVAEYQGQIIGMIGAQRIAENSAELRRLRVHRDFRRRGIGTRLMETALQFCQHHSYLKIVLDVRIDRGPAISLFEKFGFQHARTRRIDGRELMDFYLDLYRDPSS